MMNIFPRFPACILIILLLLPVTAAAGDFAGADTHDPLVCAVGPVGAVGVKPTTTTPTGVPIEKILITVTPHPTGLLNLGSVPSGATVYVDGSLKGTTPVTVSAIPTGSHVVLFQKDGYDDYKATAIVTSSSVAKVTAVLVPKTTAPAPAVPAPVAGTTTPAQATTTMISITGPIRVASETTVPVTRKTVQQTITEQSASCTRQFFGTGEMEKTADGRLHCTTRITTNDQIATLSIMAGTIVHDPANQLVTEIQIIPVDSGEVSPGPGSDGKRWTGRAYHFLPDRTTFSSPVVVSFTLGQDEWGRSDPKNLTVMTLSGTGEQPEVLPSTIDPVTRTISATAHHFSIIGLFSTDPVTDLPPQQSSGQTLERLVRTATDSGHGSLPLSPLIPDAYAPLAAVIAGTLLSAGAATTAGSRLVSGLWEKILSLLRQFLSSETISVMSAQEIEKRALRPSDNLSAVILGLSWREILVIILSAFVFALAFLLQDRLELHLTTLLIFVGAGGVATILHDLAHRYAAYRVGCITEYQFWSLGMVTMLLTAWLFGNAFAKPSRTLIRGGKPISPEEAAVIRLAGPIMSLGVAVLSLLLIPLGGFFTIAGSAGFTMNLLNAVFSLVPVQPNDGVDVWTWNRIIWAVVFLPLLIFYLYVYIAL